jgi:hypothetical protein
MSRKVKVVDVEYPKGEEVVLVLEIDGVVQRVRIGDSVLVGDGVTVFENTSDRPCRFTVTFEVLE